MPRPRGRPRRCSGHRVPRRHEDQVHLAQAGRGRGHQVGIVAVSVTSSVIVSTSDRAQGLELVRRRGQAGLVAADEHDAPQRRATRARRIERPMSEVPPTTTAVWACPSRRSCVALVPLVPLVPVVGRPRRPRRARPSPPGGDGARPRRRDRSEARMPAGSTRARTSPLGQMRVRRLEQLGAEPGVLGQVHGPRPRPRACRARRAADRAAAPAGRSKVRVEPSIGNDSGPGSPGPNRFNTFTNDGHTRTLSAWHDAASSPAPTGTTNWYAEAPRPYMRFQAPTPSSGWKYTAIDCSSPAPRPGALRNHGSLNAPRSRLEEARRRRHGHLGPHAGSKRSASARRGRGGPRAGRGRPGRGWPGPMADPAPGSRSTPPSSGTRSSRSVIAGDAVVEVAGALGVDRMVAVSTGSSPDGGVDHDPGQSHASGGGPEELGSVVRTDLEPSGRAWPTRAG